MNFQGFLKQSTSVNVTVLIIDSSDHITGKTGATLTIYLTKAGGTPASIAPTVTELDSTNVKGLYKLALSTTSWTDTLGEMQLHITGTGCDPADYKWQVSARLPDDLAFPATSGRSMVVDAAGLVDANMVKAGPTGSGTAITARDIGASVLLSAGSGAGQLDFTSGVVKANATQWLGGTIPAVNVTGVPLVDLKYTLGTISPATAGSVRADSVTAGVTVTTNNDKSGYSLSQTFPANFSAMAITAGGVVSASGNWSIAGDAMALTGGERTSLAGVINTTAITESYRANGAAPTHAQFMSEVLAHLGESSISGTTKTVKGFDHATTKATYTLDSAVTPAAITRAT